MKEVINYIKEVKDLNCASEKYVVKYNDRTYESDNEQDIMAIMIAGYIEIDDPNMQLLYRIDFARGLAMLSLIDNKNVDIVNGNIHIEENYAANKEDPDYKKDYKEADIILNVESDLIMFSGINRMGYANIYFKGYETYKLIK